MTETFGLHNAISQLMILSQSLSASPLSFASPVKRACFEAFVRLLYPFAPQWSQDTVTLLRLELTWPKEKEFEETAYSGESQNVPFELWVGLFLISDTHFDQMGLKMKGYRWTMNSERP